MLNERGHDCDGCEHFRWAEAKMEPAWTPDIKEIKVEIPICVRIVYTLAIRKCDCFEATELRKQATGHFYGVK